LCRVFVVTGIASCVRAEGVAAPLGFFIT